MAIQTNSPEQHPFMNSSVILTLTGSVSETIKVMAQAATKFDKAFVEKNWQSPSDVSVVVDLDSPPNRGQIRFHFSGRVLTEFCKRMLSENVEPDSREILDCSGELSNMFFGFAKAKLNESGYNFKLSIPKPFNKGSLPVITSNHSNVILPFKVLNETCYIQIVVL